MTNENANEAVPRADDANDAEFVQPEEAAPILCPGVRLAPQSDPGPSASGAPSSSGEDTSDERFLKQHMQLRWQGYFNDPNNDSNPYEARPIPRPRCFFFPQRLQ